MDYLWDGILVLLIAFCIFFSMKKGFISASRSIVSLILTAVLLASMQPVIMEYLEGSQIKESVRSSVSKNITLSFQKENLPEDADTSNTEDANLICETIGFPKFIENSLKTTVSGMSELKNNVMDVITDSITLMILKLLSIVLLFIIVKAFVFLILKILESLFKLPGLRTINSFLGALLGIVNALLAVYLICGAVSLFAPADKLSLIEETVGNTYILKYFYENNILLSLFI